MTKRILLFLVVLMMGAVIIGCSKRPPPYDARAIDESELDTQDRQERPVPAAGGGKALSERQW